jgi:hypothetical protein
MTERITVDEYRKMTGQNPSKIRDKKSERQRRLAWALLLDRMEKELGVPFGGVWKKDTHTQPKERWSYAEYPFAEEQGRKYRLDLAIPTEKIGIEIHGVGGAHHSIPGRQRDMEKARLANTTGWVYLEYSWRDVSSGLVLLDLAEIFSARGVDTGPPLR